MVGHSFPKRTTLKGDFVRCYANRFPGWCNCGAGQLPTYQWEGVIREVQMVFLVQWSRCEADRPPDVICMGSVPCSAFKQHHLRNEAHSSNGISLLHVWVSCLSGYKASPEESFCEMHSVEARKPFAMLVALLVALVLRGHVCHALSQMCCLWSSSLLKTLHAWWLSDSGVFLIKLEQVVWYLTAWIPPTSCVPTRLTQQTLVFDNMGFLFHYCSLFPSCLSYICWRVSFGTTFWLSRVRNSTTSRVRNSTTSWGDHFRTTKIGFFEDFLWQILVSISVFLFSVLGPISHLLLVIHHLCKTIFFVWQRGQKNLGFFSRLCFSKNTIK